MTYCRCGRPEEQRGQSLNRLCSACHKLVGNCHCLPMPSRFENGKWTLCQMDYERLKALERPEEAR